MRLLAMSLLLTGCIGGQSHEARQESSMASATAPAASPEKPERDWKKAATGHGAVGVVPSAIVEKMNRESAPGGNLSIGKPADAHEQ